MLKAFQVSWLIASAGQVIKDGVLVTEGSRIWQVTDRKGLDGLLLRGKLKKENLYIKKGYLLSPCFVNAHSHQYGLLSHGIPSGKGVVDFETFLSRYWWPLIENRIGKKEVLATCRMSMARMLKSGVGIFCDILEAPLTEDGSLILQGEEIKRAGMKAIIGLESSERISPDNGERCLEENVSAVRRFKGDDLVRGSVCTHTTFTCPPDFIKKAAGLARDQGAMLQFHLSESRYEPDTLRKKTGMEPAALYRDLNALGPHTLATQCVKVSDEEIRILKESGTGVVHMPISNCEVGGGVSPVPAMLKAGIPAALGSDGYIDDFFEVCRAAFLIHKAYLESTEVMPSRTVFRMATENGARVLGMKDSGILKAGNSADFFLCRMDLPTPVTRDNIFDQLILHTKSESVTDVFVNGRQLLSDGKCLTLDEDAASEEMRDCARQFWEGVK